MQRSYHGARRLVTARRSLHSTTTHSQASRSSTGVPSTRNGKNSTSSSKAVTRNKRQRSQGEHAVSILEQLFPRELGAGRRASSVRTPAREIPIHPLDDALGDGSSNTLQPSLGVVRFKTERGRDRAQLDAVVSSRDEGERIGVLKVQGGTASLCDSDFRRLAPSGQHIDGWTVQGSLLEVIPIRSPTTLTRIPSYYLIFRNWHSANSYRSHISSVHATANTTTHYLYPKRPLPTTAPSTTQTFSHQAASYTAMPPGANLQTKLLPANTAVDTAAVYKLAGWTKILEGRRSDFEVLLWTAFSKVLPHILYRTIERDGQQRRMPWALLEPTPTQLVEANPGADVKFQACMRELTLPRSEPRFLSLDSKPPSITTSKYKPLSYSSYSSERRIGEGRGIEGKGEGLRRRDELKKYILSFSSEYDARRFVLAWHKRDIATLLESVDPGRMSEYSERREVLVNAELLFE